jgi:hypothetical protein
LLARLSEVYEPWSSLLQFVGNTGDAFDGVRKTNVGGGLHFAVADDAQAFGSLLAGLGYLVRSKSSPIAQARGSAAAAGGGEAQALAELLSVLAHDD